MVRPFLHCPEIDEEDEIETWCEILNKQWANRELCVASFIMMCGNYFDLYFIYKRQDVEKLSDLCSEVNQDIKVVKRI